MIHKIYNAIDVDNYITLFGLLLEKTIIFIYIKAFISMKYLSKSTLDIDLEMIRFD
jgi:hypothetical protein